MNNSLEHAILRDRGSAATPTNDLSLLSVSSVQSNTAGSRVSDGHGSQPVPEPRSAQQDPNSWTYLVNLTATMVPVNEAGSGYKYNQLVNLRNLTKNSTSTVIVQEFESSTGMLKRYEIAHGQIHTMQPVKSGGTAMDLQNLLATAPRSGHLALINEAHGNGDLGFEDDAGKLSVSDFQRAVKTGLASDGRTSLDLLSMDSCLMANVQVLDKLSGLAKNVVASELEEFSSVAMGTPSKTNFDMQPIDLYLSEMLKHPPKDGREAANDILSVSAKSCDAFAPKLQGCGTPTLAIYNPQAAHQSALALDQFGTQLQLAIHDAKAKKNVDSLIGQLKDVSEVPDHLRDVDGFAQGVIDLINRGTIKDSNHVLKQAAQNVLTADRDLVRSVYVNPQARIVQYVGQNSIHGLNTFLPGPDFDVRDEAENIVGPVDAKKLPFDDLLNKEVQRSLPDDDSGGWSGFVKAMRH
jgi:hypothetical protein